MSVYDEATPWLDMEIPEPCHLKNKFAEAIGAPRFSGNEWANTSLIQSEPLWADKFQKTDTILEEF